MARRTADAALLGAAAGVLVRAWRGRGAVAPARPRADAGRLTPVDMLAPDRPPGPPDPP